MSCEVRGMGVSVMTGLGSGDLSMGFSSSLSWWIQRSGGFRSLEFPLYLWEPFEDFEAARFLQEKHRGNDERLISFTQRRWPKYEEEAECDWASYFFWWDVVRRVHRKAPTTTTIMVKAPTEMMMMMTRMWFSLPPTPDLPREERDWIRLDACVSKSLRDTKGNMSHFNTTGNMEPNWQVSKCTEEKDFIFIFQSPTFTQSDHDLRDDGWEKLTNSIDRVLWWVSLRPMFRWNIWGWFKMERKKWPHETQVFLQPLLTSHSFLWDML